MSDETVLYNPDTNQFCVLNETASFIWDLIVEPTSVEELRERLMAEFEGVEPDQAEADIQDALGQLTDLAIVVAE